MPASSCDRRRHRARRAAGRSAGGRRPTSAASWPRRARSWPSEATTTAERASACPQRAERAATVAGKAVRTVVETASRLREQGVRSTLIGSLDDFTDWALEHRSDIARVASEGRPGDHLLLRHRELHRRSTPTSATSSGSGCWSPTTGCCTPRSTSTGARSSRARATATWSSSRRPQLAVDASLDIQRALSAKRQRSRHLRRTPIRVRIGLHVGETIERDGDYFGSNVAMAARVAALADGGEILVTDDVADALERPRRTCTSSRRAAGRAQGPARRAPALAGGAGVTGAGRRRRERGRLAPRRLVARPGQGRGPAARPAGGGRQRRPGVVRRDRAGARGPGAGRRTGGRDGGLRTVHAPRDGDATIVAQAARAQAARGTTWWWSVPTGPW